MLSVVDASNHSFSSSSSSSISSGFCLNNYAILNSLAQCFFLFSSNSFFLFMASSSSSLICYNLPSSLEKSRPLPCDPPPSPAVSIFLKTFIELSDDFSELLANYYLLKYCLSLIPKKLSSFIFMGLIAVSSSDKAIY